MNLIAYYRVSSDSQADNTSIEKQQTACQRWAAFRGASIIGEYKEVVSGSKQAQEREQFNRALEHMARSADGLVVYEIDRYGRNLEYGLTAYRQHFQENGKVLLAASQFLDTSEELHWEMFAQCLLDAEKELRRIKRRMSEGKRIAAEQGRWLGGTPPYGYRADERKEGVYLAQCSKEFPHVLTMQRLKREGKTSKEVADYLNDRGITTRTGKDWSRQLVDRVLKREAR